MSTVKRKLAKLLEDLGLPPLKSPRQRPVEPFTKQVFLGSGVSSEEDVDRIHELVEETLNYLSGIQQCPMSTDTEEQVDDYKEYVVEAEQKMVELVKEINIALLGPDYLEKIV